jgi:serine phosphatase RsbU (regulator of sigma subunit)/anti-sigma regulatory factor (Ser/Thr protein kinase)
VDSRQSAAGVLATPRPDSEADAAAVGAGDRGAARRRGGWDPLDELAVRVGSTLDPVITAQEVADLVVPGLADHASILLRESMLSGTGAAEPRDGPIRLVRLAISAWDVELAAKLRAAWPVGQVIVVPEATPHARAMRSHEVIIEPVRTLPPTADDADVTELSEDRPAVFAPLLVGGRVLGVMVFTRDPVRGPFRPAEVTVIQRVAARASIWMDNARLHDQLRHTAITMQKAMLPTKLAAPAGLEIAHRYLPGSDMAVVGGDWFDVIELSGGRVALVVGDVMGHGVQAASAMGQMRTAVRTLAGVDLPPAEVLAHLDDLMPDIDDSLFATCVYAVYDPATQQCSISRAGHVPPLVVHPDGRTEVLHQVAPGLPLGLGGAMGTFDTLDIELPDGSLFVLCTDGLLENKARDIDSGLNLLRANLAGPGRPLQEICDQVVKELDLNKDRDDIALLIARVHPLPADRSATWWLPGEPRQVAHCRRLVRDTLAAWQLRPLTETVELLVSELVTNAIQHAGGEIRLRLQREESGLLCEVCDQTRTPPELQELSATAERGRGILLVNELSRKWGHRRTASGKIVWFTLDAP